MNTEDEFKGPKGDKAFVDTLLTRIFKVNELRSNDELCHTKLAFLNGIINLIDNIPTMY